MSKLAESWQKTNSSAENNEADVALISTSGSTVSHDDRVIGLGNILRRELQLGQHEQPQTDIQAHTSIFCIVTTLSSAVIDTGEVF